MRQTLQVDQTISNQPRPFPTEEGTDCQEALRQRRGPWPSRVWTTVPPVQFIRNWSSPGFRRPERPICHKLLHGSRWWAIILHLEPLEVPQPSMHARVPQQTFTKFFVKTPEAFLAQQYPVPNITRAPQRQTQVQSRAPPNPRYAFCNFMILSSILSVSYLWAETCEFPALSAARGPVAVDIVCRVTWSCIVCVLVSVKVVWGSADSKEQQRKCAAQPSAANPQTRA